MSLLEFSEDYPVLCGHLLDLRRGGRRGHAYLLSGDDSEFLARFARAWAATCACQTPRADGEPCGTCGPCTDFAANRYAEFYVLRPASRSRQILIDEIRGFEHQVSLTAAPGRLKVGLIVDADRLNEQAQNAFLKTLEEPPGNVMLILVTTQPRGLLPTIRSRCQVLSLLRNRRSYDFAEQTGLFGHLARLRRGAGTAQGLAAAAGVRAVFGGLKEAAKAAVPEAEDGGAALADYDATFHKRLEEARLARVQAEYLRLRQQVIDAIQVWFQQRVLVANGVTVAELPQSELAPPEGFGAIGTPEEAEADVRQAADLSRFLAGNVDERLAIETFCLAVCRKVS